MVRISFNHAPEFSLEFHLRLALDQLGLAKILKPAFRTLHAVQPPMRAIGKWNCDALALGNYREVAAHPEVAGNGDVTLEVPGGTVTRISRNRIDSIGVANRLHTRISPHRVHAGVRRIQLGGSAGASGNSHDAGPSKPARKVALGRALLRRTANSDDAGIVDLRR